MVEYILHKRDLRLLPKYSAQEVEYVISFQPQATSGSREALLSNCILKEEAVSHLTSCILNDLF